MRDPRYGRNSELPSEDPVLTGGYGTEVVLGQQSGADPNWPLKIHATLKHFTAYSVESDRFGFSGNTTLYDLFDSFLPQYEAAFTTASAAGVMCSYMSLNGLPSCANEFLLNHLVREEWGREDALIVTDCEAVSSMYQHNHYAKDCPDAAAKSINAGVDLNTGAPWWRNGCLNASLVAGTVQMATVNTALNRSLLWRFRLGLFDDPATQRYAQTGIESVNSSSTQELVQQAAAQGLVLLRNRNLTLPLGRSRKVAVVGAHATTTRGR